VSIIEEERFCSSHTGHRSKETPKSASFFVLASFLYQRKESREQPHLLAGFSPILGFPGHILCLFVDGVIVFYCSLFFTFYLFHA
jgi:hypothetical protein